jgi:Big-like domain-containing protein
MNSKIKKTPLLFRRCFAAFGGNTINILLAIILSMVFFASSSLAIAAVTPGFALENDSLRITANGTGQITEVYAKATAGDYLISPASFAWATVNGVSYSASSCVSENGEITLTFNGGSATLVVAVETASSYFTFEVTSATANITEIRLMYIGTPFLNVYDTSGIATDYLYALFMRSLSHSAQATPYQPNSTSSYFRIFAKDDYGIVGVRFAFGGCLFANVRDELKTLAIAEGVVSSNQTGGPWALDSALNNCSYTFSAEISQSNANDWASLADSGKVGLVLFEAWYDTAGHYTPKASRFPGGVSSMASTVDVLNANGVKAGLYTLSTFIHPTDAYVTPTPDAGLAKDAWFTLSVNTNSTTNIIYVTQPVTNLSTATYNNVIQIGSELISYTGYSSSYPYSFTGCVRGWNGTSSAAHSMGVDVSHLYSRFNGFFPDPDSPLLDAVATNLANLINQCDFDMIYLDATDGMPGEWYGIAKAKEAIISKFDHPVRVETANWDHYSWTSQSVIGTLDWPFWGRKTFIDGHCELSSDYSVISLLPSQLGWWRFMTSTADYKALSIDELEYLCAKSIGFDMPISLQGLTVNPSSGHGRQSEYLDIVNNYETMRLSGECSPEMIALLREPERDFHMKTLTDNSLALVEANYDSHNVTDTVSKNWSVNNPFGLQKPRFRIEALDSAVGYDQSTLVFPDFQSGVTPVNGPLVSASLVWTSTLPPDVSSVSGSLQFSAVSTRTERDSAWARASFVYSTPFDMGVNRAMGVWIYGDGLGEIINFELLNSAGYRFSPDVHIVTIDFVGWRYFILPLRERSVDEYYDHTWPSSVGDSYSFFASCIGTTVTSSIGTLNIYLNNLPPNGQPVECYITPVKAIMLATSNVQNPSITLGSMTINIPTTLTSRDYVELNSLSDCKRYNENGFLQENISLAGSAVYPILLAGNNSIAFNYTTSSSYDSRTKVTIISDNCSEPTIEITNPIANETFAAGDDVVVAVNAIVPSSSISLVEIYQGTTLLGSALASGTLGSYEFTWLSPPFGNYALTAKAYYDSTSATSSVVNIVVEQPELPSMVVYQEDFELAQGVSGDNWDFAINPGGCVLLTDRVRCSSGLQGATIGFRPPAVSGYAVVEDLKGPWSVSSPGNKMTASFDINTYSAGIGSHISRDLLISVVYEDDTTDSLAFAYTGTDDGPDTWLTKSNTWQTIKSIKTITAVRFGVNSTFPPEWKLEYGLDNIEISIVPNQIAGDANNDGAVDVGDLGILAANYGTSSGATWSQGDFNGDGGVDVGDLGILAANYGSGSSSAVNFDADYAKVFGDDSADAEAIDDQDVELCGALGLPIIGGLVFISLLFVRFEKD